MTTVPVTTLTEMLEKHGIEIAGLAREKVQCYRGKHGSLAVSVECAVCLLRFNCVVTYLWGYSQTTGGCERCPDMKTCQEIFDKRC